MKRRSVITGFGIKLPKIHNSLQLEKVLKDGICTHSIVPGLGPNQESLVCGIIDEELAESKEKALRGYPEIACSGSQRQRKRLNTPESKTRRPE